MGINVFCVHVNNRTKKCSHPNLPKRNILARVLGNGKNCILHCVGGSYCELQVKPKRPDFRPPNQFKARKGEVLCKH